MNAFLALQEWSPAGHDLARSWREALGTFGPWALAVAIAALVLRAWLHRKRYRAVDALSPQDLEQLHEAVREAERRTVGEIVPVVVERSDSHSEARWIAAVFFAVLGTALLAERLPWNEPGIVVGAQLALGLAGFALAHLLPGFARVFVGEGRATEVAEEQALQEFQRLELHRTEAATGVLIFVSLFERRVVVLGDRGIHEHVGGDYWEEVDRAILDSVSRGDLESGLSEGIRRCGAILAERFPWSAGDRNELPDRVVVRRR